MNMFWVNLYVVIHATLSHVRNPKHAVFGLRGSEKSARCAFSIIPVEEKKELRLILVVLIVTSVSHAFVMRLVFFFYSRCCVCSPVHS